MRADIATHTANSEPFGTTVHQTLLLALFSTLVNTNNSTINSIQCSYEQTICTNNYTLISTFRPAIFTTFLESDHTHNNATYLSTNPGVHRRTIVDSHGGS